MCVCVSECVGQCVYPLAADTKRLELSGICVDFTLFMSGARSINEIHLFDFLRTCFTRSLPTS